MLKIQPGLGVAAPLCIRADSSMLGKGQPAGFSYTATSPRFSADPRSWSTFWWTFSLRSCRDEGRKMGSWLEGYPHLDIAGPSTQSLNTFKVWSRLFRLHLVSEWLLSPVSHADSELFLVFTQLLNCVLLTMLHRAWCAICPCRLTNVGIRIPLVWWHPVL